MHELSIATSIVKTAEQEVIKIQGQEVTEITLEIGKISGVEIDSLTFVWPQCIEHSVLKNARLIILEPAGSAKCAECNTQFHIEKIYDLCPECKSPFKEILSGKEMKVKKLIII